MEHFPQYADDEIEAVYIVVVQNHCIRRLPFGLGSLVGNGFLNRRGDGMFDGRRH